MSRHIKVIGVGGVARAGKDTFVSILRNELGKQDLTSTKIALADPLKGYADDFLRQNLGLSAYTQVPAEKVLIRPMLVWFGDAKRKQTNGRFWVDLASKKIEEAEQAGIDYAIVSDVRYDHYDQDELHWLKEEQKGILVHVSRFELRRPVTTKVSNPTIEKIFVPPANDHEAINDPKIKSAAHHVIEWPTFETDTSPALTEYVREFMKLYI